MWNDHKIYDKVKLKVMSKFQLLMVRKVTSCQVKIELEGKCKVASKLKIVFEEAEVELQVHFKLKAQFEI